MVKNSRQSLNVIKSDLVRLMEHVKKYNKGVFPAVFLSLHTAHKPVHLLDMRLSHIYQCEEGRIRVKRFISHKGSNYVFGEGVRRELAWYIIQRVPVRNAEKGSLEQPLCVNKMGLPLQISTYRKILHTFCRELDLARNYTPQYLHSLYGYFEIACGNKTADLVAAEYGVSKHYLTHTVLREFDICNIKELVEEVAGINVAAVE